MTILDGFRFALGVMLAGVTVGCLISMLVAVYYIGVLLVEGGKR